MMLTKARNWRGVRLWFPLFQPSFCKALRSAVSARIQRDNLTDAARREGLSGK